MTLKIEQNKDRGAVLLTTLLVMAIMATVAVTILEELRFAVKRAVNVENHAQADWYTKGAEAFAETWLKNSLSQISASDLDDYFLSNAETPFVFPLDDDGVMRFAIRDGGDCVALGAIDQAPVQRQFQTLLTELGWTEFEAETLTARVVDWQDSDNTTRQNGAEDFVYLGNIPAHRTANTPFSSVSELRAVQGVTADDMTRLRPYLCARPLSGSPKISVNSLGVDQAIILSTLISDTGRYEIARQLIENRPQGGYTGIDQMIATPALENIDSKMVAFDMMAFETENIWVEAEIVIGTSARYIALEFALKGNTFQKIYRRQSAEAFRPRLPKPVENPS